MRARVSRQNTNTCTTRKKTNTPITLQSGCRRACLLYKSPKTILEKGYKFFFYKKRLQNCAKRNRRTGAHHRFTFSRREALFIAREELSTETETGPPPPHHTTPGGIASVTREARATSQTDPKSAGAGRGPAASPSPGRPGDEDQTNHARPGLAGCPPP